MIRLLVLASAFAVGACGGGAQKPAPAEPEQIGNRQPDTTPAAAPAPATPASDSEVALAKMREFTAKMCACADMTCAQHVSEEMTEWSQAFAKRQTDPVKMSEEQTQSAVEIGTKMGECMQKAMSAGAQPAQP